MSSTTTTIDDLQRLDDPEAAAKRAGLRYVSDGDPGVSRRRRGRGFSYHAADGSLIDDPDERERFASLAVPPAWSDVWICPHPDGHIQATGRDDRGRKQYRYHPDWRAIRDRAKYARMIPFARALPGIRRGVSGHLRRKGLPREKVLAAVVRLLEVSLIRIGNDEYARENESYGLVTMRDRHVEFARGAMRFEFRGKGGKKHRVEVDDPRLAKVVKACRDVPGYEVFQYFDETGEKRDVKSEDVNGYLEELSGEPFTAKDFRTWAGTIRAAAALLDCGACDDDREARQRVNESLEIVAERLGNTVAVCRECYVHPDVIDHYLAGRLAELLDPAGDVVQYQKIRGLSEEECAVLALLEHGLTESASAL